MPTRGKVEVPNPFSGDEEFLRRISPSHFNFSTQEIQSWAFDNLDDTPGRMSVNWSGLATVQETVQDHPGFGVASITARSCYDEKQGIEYTPVKDHPSLRDNPAHCDVVGDKPKGVQRRLRNSVKALLLRPEAPPD